MGKKPPPNKKLVPGLGLSDEEKKILPVEIHNFVSDTKKQSRSEFADLTDRQIRVLAEEFLETGSGERYWGVTQGRRHRWPRHHRQLSLVVQKIMTNQRRYKKGMVRKMASNRAAYGRQSSSDEEELEDYDSTYDLKSDDFSTPNYDNYPANSFARHASPGSKSVEVGGCDRQSNRTAATHQWVESHDPPIVPPSTYSNTRLIPEHLYTPDFAEQQDIIHLPHFNGIHISQRPQLQARSHSVRSLAEVTDIRRQQEPESHEQTNIIKRAETVPYPSPASAYDRPNNSVPKVDSTSNSIIVSDITNNVKPQTSSRRSHRDLLPLNRRLYAPLQLADASRDFLRYVSAHQNKHLEDSVSEEFSDEKQAEHAMYAKLLKDMAAEMDIIARSYAFDAADDEKAKGELILKSLDLKEE